jgi:hypothetical protein
MTEPEQALERARAAAASMRERGAYSEDTRRAPPPAGAVTTAQLSQWAAIDPDIGAVRSTRPYGAPLTAAKRVLVRLLSQYHADLISQQTRFNVKVVEELERLERRVEELERRSEPAQ